MTLQGRVEIAEQQLQVYKKQTLELASQALEQYRNDLKLVDKAVADLGINPDKANPAIS